MATCFCAYVRKMKELEILPQLSYDSEEVAKQNYQNVSTLMSAISPLDYAKDRIFKNEVEAMTGEMEEFIPPEEKEVFHVPFFFET